MPRLFEQTIDNDPTTTNRISFGRAGFPTLNMALSSFLTWLNNNLSFSSNPTIETIIEIGDWDMVADDSIVVAHGLTFTKIRTVEAMIINDAGTELALLKSWDASSLRINGGEGIIDATNIVLERRAAALFDDIAYDATSYNRGWITIKYIP